MKKKIQIMHFNIENAFYLLITRCSPDCSCTVRVQSNLPFERKKGILFILTWGPMFDF